MKIGMTKFFPWARSQKSTPNKIESEVKAISWEPTRACNLNCRHCALNCTPYKQSERTVDPYVVMDTFSALAECCNPEETFICVNGGEPTLYPYLFLVASHLRDLGFSWGMMTNGVEITRNMVARCKDAGMSSVSISIDGPERKHDLVRGPGTYNRTLRALKYYREANYLDLIQVTTCVGGHNVSSLKEMSSICTDLNVDQWRLLRMQCEGRAADNEEVALDAYGREYLSDFVELESLTTGRPEIVFGGDDYQGADFAVVSKKEEKKQQEEASLWNWEDLRAPAASSGSLRGLIPVEADTTLATSMLPGNLRRRS